MNAKAFGGGRRDFAMSFRWGEKDRGPSFSVSSHSFR
jgi:hypothetical protein